jgi:hypothetical protein
MPDKAKKRIHCSYPPIMRKFANVYIYMHHMRNAFLMDNLAPFPFLFFKSSALISKTFSHLIFADFRENFIIRICRL